MNKKAAAGAFIVGTAAALAGGVPLHIIVLGGIVAILVIRRLA